MECTRTGRKKFIGTLILMEDSPDADQAQVVDGGVTGLTTIFIYVGLLRDLFDSLSHEQLPSSGIATFKTDPKGDAERINNDKLNLNYRFIPNSLIRDLYLTYVAPDPKVRVPRPLMPTRHQRYTVQSKTNRMS